MSTSHLRNALGERATRQDAAGVTGYGWDRLGNLLSVDRPGAASIDYVYDALNRRIGKKVDNALTASWLYDGQLRIVAEIAGGSITKRFYYGSRSNVPDVMVVDTLPVATTYRLVTDHLGSVRLVVNASSGVVAQRIDYDARGVATLGSGSVEAFGFQPFGFAGGLYDDDTKLVHFGARDYDPALGAWLSKDQARFAGGLNFYAYANSDPVNFVDPTGRTPKGAAIGGGIGFGFGGLPGAGLGAWLGDQLSDALEPKFDDGPLDGGMCGGPPPPENGPLETCSRVGSSGCTGSGSKRSGTCTYSCPTHGQLVTRVSCAPAQANPDCSDSINYP